MRSSEKTGEPVLRRLLRSAAPFAAGALLFGFVVTRSLVACLESANPDLALALRSTDADAALQIASRNLSAHDGTVSGGSESIDAGPSRAAIRQQNRERILRVLYDEPLNARAFELLGAISVEEGDAAAANTFMRAASTLTLRSPAALYWMLNRSLFDGGVASGITFADALLRIRPSPMPFVGPALAKIAVERSGADGMIAALARNPPWRSAFFRFLNSDMTYASVSLKLLTGLETSTHPTTDQEIGGYIWALANNRKFALAYYAWLQFLSPKKAKAVKLLFNGGFGFAPETVPFDWSIQGGNGVIAQVGKDISAPGQNALSLELGSGRVDFLPISQLLVLPAGRYRFSGFSKGRLDGPRGLRWQVACVVSSSKPIGETPMLLGAIPAWTEFSIRFDVLPACAAQTVRLILDARSASETLVSGSIAFADLRIKKD